MASSPLAIFRWIHWCEGLKRRVCPTMHTRPVRLLQVGHRLRVSQLVGQGYFDLHVLAGLQAGDGLGCVQLCRGRQDGRLHTRALQRFGQFGGCVPDAVASGQSLGRLQGAADEGNHLHVADGLDGVEVFRAKGAAAGEDDLHGRLSSTR